MFHIVNDFENTVAEFFGAPYAVATDCCTHAIELCLRYTQANHVGCPEYTYPSIPMTFMKLGLNWHWQDVKWQENYTIDNTNIIDSATQWRENSYQSGSFMCISFQFQKHISLGRGGMILLDNKQDHETLSLMRYDGRDLSKRWMDQDISVVGYHYYMTPETAQQGLEQFAKNKHAPAKIWNWEEYKYLPDMKVFQ